MTLADSPLGPSHVPEWADTIPTATRTAFWGGMLVLLLFVGGFGYWAATAPLSGAVIAEGLVRADGQNQLVEHLEGGIIGEIHVVEGDSVTAGDPILTLDNTHVAVEAKRVRLAIALTEARLARANAELLGKDALSFTPALLAKAREENLEHELEQQRAEFANRLTRHQAELATLDQRISAAREEISGLEIHAQSQRRTLEILREELSDKKTLLSKNLTTRAQYNALLRGEAETLGEIGTDTASIGQRRASIAELTDQQAALKATRREEAARQINELGTTLGDLREQLRSRNETLSRSMITAPVSGTVVSLAKNTIGGTVRPGEAIAEILPEESELVVEARIAPTDVDAVTLLQSARLRLVALNARVTPEVGAEVTYLSADRLTDPATHQPFYTVRLRFTDQFPPSISRDAVTAGMPVQVLIDTGARTFVEYLLKPIRDSLSKAFREE